MLELINDIFNPANAFEVLSVIPGTGIESPHEIIDIEAQEIKL